MSPFRFVRWLDEPSAETGMYFSVRREWRFRSYQDLATRSARFAAGINARVASPAGRRLVIALESGEDFVNSLLGAWRLGMTVSPSAPPALSDTRERYAERIRHVVATAEAPLVLTRRPNVEVVRAALAGIADADQVVATEDLDDAGLNWIRHDVDWPLLQFTSGSLRAPKGVRIHATALDDNLAAIGDWLALGPETRAAHWLPYHHDMGLVGGLLASMATQSTVWNMATADFLRDPTGFLHLLGRESIEITPTPAFGLDRIVARATPDDLDGLNFSSMRAVIVGAERVNPRSVAAFVELLGPCGLTQSAIRPAYGLAEATLAVTGLPLGAVARILTVDRAGTALGDVVIRVSSAEEGMSLMSNGPALGTAQVQVENNVGVPLSEGCVGEIVVAGCSLASGYEGAPDGGSSRFSGNRLHTGDIGFLDQGELFVLGRAGDSIKVRAVPLFAEDLESRVLDVGVPAHDIAVSLGLWRGTAHVVALVNRSHQARSETISATLRAAAEGAEVHVKCLNPRAIPRTTSGKPRRRAIWNSFVQDLCTKVPS
jgi:acyl-CoA synthetase (AMP-forming)/AMP-acid ligase II